VIKECTDLDEAVSNGPVKNSIFDIHTIKARGKDKDQLEKVMSFYMSSLKQLLRIKDPSGVILYRVSPVVKEIGDSFEWECVLSTSPALPVKGWDIENFFDVTWQVPGMSSEGIEVVE
jgi:hypothetical protein